MFRAKIYNHLKVTLNPFFLNNCLPSPTARPTVRGSIDRPCVAAVIINLWPWNQSKYRTHLGNLSMTRGIDGVSSWWNPQKVLKLDILRKSNSWTTPLSTDRFPTYEPWMGSLVFTIGLKKTEIFLPFWIRDVTLYPPPLEHSSSNGTQANTKRVGDKLTQLLMQLHKNKHNKVWTFTPS